MSILKYYLHSVRLRKALTRLRASGLTRAIDSVGVCRVGSVRIALDLSLPFHRSIYLGNGFEAELTRVICKSLPRGGVFVDVGANIGWHSLTLLASRPDVPAVYAFEPSARCCHLLKRSRGANGFGPRLHVRRYALAGAAGTVRLKRFPGMDLMHSSLFPLGDEVFQEEDVPAVTFDSQAEGFLGPPSVVKCDVEGGERGVLLGAERALSGAFGDPPVWLLEANYETAAMAGYFPFDLIDMAASFSPYVGHFIRGGKVLPLPHRKALRHGDTLILAIPKVHHCFLHGLGR